MSGDSDAYLALMLAAYAPSRKLGVHFDAATATSEKVEQHLQQHGVYGLFIDNELAASITLRYPWGPLPGPFGLPHIGWFVPIHVFVDSSAGSKFMTGWKPTSCATCCAHRHSPWGRLSTIPGLLISIRSGGLPPSTKRTWGKAISPCL